MKARLLLNLYPRAWRRRYGQELEGSLEARRLTFSLAIDLLLGALDAQLICALSG
jgi:hypothetical protein